MYSNILIGAAAFIAGIGVGIMYADKKAERQREEEIANQIRDARAEVQSRYIPVKEEPVIAEAPEVKVENPTEPPEWADKVPEKKEFDKLIEENEYEGSREIHSITKDEYDNTHEWFDKVELVYYTEDDVLTNEDNEVLDDDSMIGNGLSLFGEDKQDMSYIRNYFTEQDYAIQRIHGSFSEMILGIPRRRHGKDTSHGTPDDE